MRPIRTSQTNFTYLAPAGMVDCDPMPCERTPDGRVVTIWEPTPGERAAIAAGQNIALHVWMQPPSPTGLAVTPATEVPG